MSPLLVQLRVGQMAILTESGYPNKKKGTGDRGKRLKSAENGILLSIVYDLIPERERAAF